MSKRDDYYIPVEDTFFEGVKLELAYADNKHKTWPEEDAVHACAILNEEAGKLTRACNDFTHSGGDWDAIRKYAMRVAAMAARFYGSTVTYKRVQK